MICLSLRFPEALEYLEQGLALVNKLGDEKLAAYRWPGSQVVIEDTKPGKLLVFNFFYYIDSSVLLENKPLVKFIKTTSGTRVVYFP